MSNPGDMSTLAAASPRQNESSTLAQASRRFGAYLAGACPVILGVVRRLSDGINHEPMWAELVAPMLARLPGSKSTPAVEKRRTFVSADFVVRQLAPQAMRVLGTTWAVPMLVACAPVTDAATARAAREVAEHIRKRAIARNDENAKTIAVYAAAVAYASYAEGDLLAASVAYYEGIVAARECLARCSVEELRPSYEIAARMVAAMLDVCDVQDSEKREST